MGFKEDADFARFVSMGAVATNAVRTDLKLHGHDAIELERFAMSNKVWQTKVKRMRLPDLVCVHCGLRIESRGKSKLGIIVSHSETNERGWEWGMRNEDLFAFLRVDTSQDPPRASTPVYFRTQNLRATFKDAKESNRKAASDGAEMTLTWASWVPSHSGILVGTDDSGRLACKWDDGTTYNYWHWRQWPSQRTYLHPGDRIIANETIVAGIVDAPDSIECHGGWNLETALSSADPGERYAAVKTAGVVKRSDLLAELGHIARHEEDWRIRLEAAASIARMDPGQVKPIIETAASPSNSEPQRIEAVFVLSEIPTDEAAEALAAIAVNDGSRTQELRAAAVWSLARGMHPRPDLVLPYAADPDQLVALHAIAGIPFLTDDLVSGLVQWLEKDNEHAAAAAQVLLRHRAVKPLLTAVHAGGRGRLWALRALGDLPPSVVRDLGGAEVTEDVERDLQPIWIGREDWLRTSGADGLDALDVQKVRFNPLIG